MEEAVIEVPTMRRFAGIELINRSENRRKTIKAFYHLLQKRDLIEQIFIIIEAHLSARGLPMRNGRVGMPP